MKSAPAATSGAQAETDQRRALIGRTASRASDLLHRDRLGGLLGRGFRHDQFPSYSATAEPPRRLSTSATFLPRREATARGLVCFFSASKVARTML